jgi:hypothetical protein
LIGKAKAALLEFEKDDKNEEILMQVIKQRDNIIDELDRELLSENHEGLQKKSSETSLIHETRSIPTNRY